MAINKADYSGLPTTNGDAFAEGPAVPVATAVLTSEESAHSSSWHSSLHGEGVPHASKKSDAYMYSKTNTGASSSHSSPRGSAITDEDGIIIEWEKGEVQPSRFRDKWFALCWLGQLVAVITSSVMFGSQVPSARKNKSSDGTDGHSEPSSPSEGFWIAILAASLLAAPALSVLALTVMSRNAEALITASLWLSIILSGLATLVNLVFAPFLAIFNAALTAFLFCYARAVRHKIPYAASNLRCAIRAISTNFGVTLISLGSVIAFIVFAIVWAVGFFGTMGLPQLQVPIAQYDGGSGTNKTGGDDNNETQLAPLGVGIAMLFLLSLYWTHEVIRNVVRTSVAGVIGTFWFSPLEASSFCSPAVRGSLLRSITYSLGSICFGSLIVAILHLLRNILRNALQNNNRDSHGILRCVVSCILLYLERMAEYFNAWAFTYVGLYGYDYITAGRRVMDLFRFRGWSVVIADNLAGRLLAVVSLAVGLLVGCCTLGVALIYEEFESESGRLGVGYFAGFVLGFILCGMLMGLLSSSVDAIIVCFAESPAELRENHPGLAEEMERSWRSAWPDLDADP